jgi:hypothetical protein
MSSFDHFCRVAIREQKKSKQAGEAPARANSRAQICATASMVVIADSNDNCTTVWWQFAILTRAAVYDVGIERRLARFLLREFSDPMRKPRHFPARSVAVHDIFLRRTDDRRLGLGHCSGGARTIARGNRLLDLAHGGANARTARFVNGGSAHGLAGSLLGGLGISHR